MDQLRTQGADSNLAFAQRSEMVMSLALLGVLVVLLIPLPTPLVDVLLAVNIALSLILLLVTLGALEPLQLSVFPSLLLLLTLYRLSLNVATTRLILLDANAGKIVSTFGGFVVGGNLVVGLVIFAILVVIQFVVITKGASRISEVAARFTLDAMPGKQMAIDAELSSGAIDEAEAQRRRQRLLRESEFYGAMDGASKFVRGDAIAGLIITMINLIGGVTIGVARNMSVAQAIRTYSVLTVGDGLVSQIPALIIATTAGILVTKATSESSLGQEIGTQMLANRRALRIGAVILCAVALTPGLPKLPFILLAGALWLAARRIDLAAASHERQQRGEPEQRRLAPAEMPVEEFLQHDRACVEIGVQLIPLVDPNRSTGLLERIRQLRRELARQHGLWIPPIRIRDNIRLEPCTYRILIGGREVARGTLRTDKLLAIDSGSGKWIVEGEETTEPAFGMPARWIEPADKQRAELAGCTVVDPTSVLITHLGEIARRYAHELLSREDLQRLIDKVREAAPTVVDELIPNVLTMGTLHRALTLLLEENVPVNNLTRILESLAQHAPATKDPVELAERVRQDIGRAICDRFRDPDGKFHAIVLDPRLEHYLRQAVKGTVLAIDPNQIQQLLNRVASEWRKATLRGREVALLADSAIRRILRHTLARALPDLAVIAYQEVPTDMILEPVAMLKLEDIVDRTQPGQTQMEAAAAAGIAGSPSGSIVAAA